jgi:aromatic ring-cleaving dioxygenase
MKRHWIKFIYERNTYVVNLDRIRTFVLTENGRLIFWVPDARGQVQIILHPQTNSATYQQILEYIQETIGQSLT